MDILGIDEAGRGSVLGPMVIAALKVFENRNEISSKEMKKRDYTFTILEPDTDILYWM